MSRSTPRLSEVARHVVAPAGIVSTGWPAVVSKCADFGVSFHDWQHGTGQLILAKRVDGKYASTIGGTGLSIPRQVGKTFLVGAIVFALCMLHPGMTVIWTAHRLRTAEETFGKMQKFAKRARIKPFVEKVILGSGEEEIRFTNGSRILFGARERGFGRGFDEVDVLIFDEGQILTDAALDDMVPATNQSRQPCGALLLFMGTPPKPTDRSEVFLRMRTESLSGEDTDTGWVEFGADPGFVPTQKPKPLTDADWAQVAKANPSYPDGTPREAIMRMRKQLGAESFVREGLGVWDDLSSIDIFGVGSWNDCARAFVKANVGAFAVAAPVDLSYASISAAYPGDRTQVRPLHKEAGLGWVVAKCKELQDKHGSPVVIDAGGPASMLVPVLQQAGIDLVIPKVAEFFNANANLFELVRERKLAHDHYPDLDDEVRDAQLRNQDRSVLDRKKSNVAVLESCMLAAWQVTKPEEPKTVSAYESHGLIVI